ncbi:MAG: tyrosine-type recombinase/integrase [Nitrosopumilaceae archaeon]
MRSFLSKKKTTESYEEKISTEPQATQLCKKYAVSNFSKFVSVQYDERTIYDIVEELMLIREKEGAAKYEEAVYQTLQEWINWNEKEKKGNYSIKVTFSNLRRFLYHLGIKTSPQDIKENLRFGRRVKEEKHALAKSEYRDIVNGYSKEPIYQALYLTLGSSGMRVGEAMNVQKMDIDTSLTRWKINIKPLTKTREGRSTFISKEAQEKLQPIIDKLLPQDFVFRKKQNWKDFHSNYQTSFHRLLKRLRLDKKYTSNGNNKITTHSFRAFFFTNAARKHGENYAHKLTGHGGYLMQYDRMTEDEKLKMYLELEPELVIFDQTKNEIEIERLKKENESIEELRKEVKNLREYQIKQDKKIVKTLKKDGVIL